MNKKKYRFFYHYYRQYDCLSIHFRNKCYRVNDIICKVPVESKWNKRQPKLVMRGFATKLEIKNDIGVIS